MQHLPLHEAFIGRTQDIRNIEVFMLVPDFCQRELMTAFRELNQVLHDTLGMDLL